MDSFDVIEMKLFLMFIKIQDSLFFKKKKTSCYAWWHTILRPHLDHQKAKKHGVSQDVESCRFINRYEEMLEGLSNPCFSTIKPHRIHCEAILKKIPWCLWIPWERSSMPIAHQADIMFLMVDIPLIEARLMLHPPFFDEDINPIYINFVFFPGKPVKLPSLFSVYVKYIPSFFGWLKYQVMMVKS